jgi:hypothetical protein
VSGCPTDDPYRISNPRPTRAGAVVPPPARGAPSRQSSGSGDPASAPGGGRAELDTGCRRRPRRGAAAFAGKRFPAPLERCTKYALDVGTRAQQDFIDGFSIAAVEREADSGIGLVVMQPVAEAKAEPPELNTGLPAGTAD